MKKFFALMLSLVMLLSVTAFAEEGNYLYWATEATFPPYEFYDEGGEVTGIDAEIADAIAKKLGYDGAKVEDMGFDSILAAVTEGKVDMALAGLTASADRMNSVYFSFPYTTSTQVVIVKEGSEITTVDDLFVEGKNWAVGAQIGTTGYLYATWDIEDAGLGTVESYPSYVDAVQALLTGKVDCVLCDAAPAAEFVSANEGLVTLETAYVTESYAIAISKDNVELLGQVTAALQDLIADGTVQSIIDKYIPAEATAE